MGLRFSKKRSLFRANAGTAASDQEVQMILEGCRKSSRGFPGKVLYSQGFGPKDPIRSPKALVESSWISRNALRDAEEPSICSIFRGRQDSGQKLAKTTCYVSAHYFHFKPAHCVSRTLINRLSDAHLNW